MDIIFVDYDDTFFPTHELDKLRDELFPKHASDKEAEEVLQLSSDKVILDAEVSVFYVLTVTDEATDDDGYGASPPKAEEGGEGNLLRA